MNPSFELVEDLYKVCVGCIYVDAWEDLDYFIDSIDVRDAHGFSFYLTEEQIEQWGKKYKEDLDAAVWAWVLEKRKEKLNG